MSKFLDLEGLGYYTGLVKGRYDPQIEEIKTNILLNTNNGVKNYYNLTKSSTTNNTVVFTINTDKSVTVNGTATPENSVFNLDNWTCTEAGIYYVVGCPTGGSWSSSTPYTYRIRVAVNDTWKGDDIGNGFAVSLAVGDVVNLQINTSTTYTANNLVFRPMICPKSFYDMDTSYQPYAMTNIELTTKEQQNENDIISGFSGCQFLADTADKATTYTFSVKRRDTRARYRYGILMAGVSAEGTSLYSIWCDTYNNVTIALIAGTSVRTFTGTLTFNGYDGTLSITPTDRQYGGIRIIWFD